MQKHIFLTLFLILFGSGNAAAAELAFINPLFNKPLHTLATVNNWDAQLMPTQISYSRAGTTVSQNCILTENRQSFVSFDCDGLYDRERRDLTKCTILPDNKYHKGTYVRCYSGNKEECQNRPIDKYWSEPGNTAATSEEEEKKRRHIFGRCWPSYSNYIIRND